MELIENNNKDNPPENVEFDIKSNWRFISVVQFGILLYKRLSKYL